MNATEKRYLLDRISCIQAAKVVEENEKYKKTQPSQEELFDRRYKLIKEGKVKLNKGCYKGYSSFSEFDFSGHEKPWNHISPREEQIVKEAGRIKDEIMLGSSEDALAMIKKFEAFKIK